LSAQSTHNDYGGVLREWSHPRLAGLARNERSDRGKRQVSESLGQFIEGLAPKKPRLFAAAIHFRIVIIAGWLGETPLSYGAFRHVMHCDGPAPCRGDQATPLEYPTSVDPSRLACVRPSYRGAPGATAPEWAIGVVGFPGRAEGARDT
jgi:hypothetical protein